MCVCNIVAALADRLKALRDRCSEARVHGFRLVLSPHPSRTCVNRATAATANTRSDDDTDRAAATKRTRRRESGVCNRFQLGEKRAQMVTMKFQHTFASTITCLLAIFLSVCTALPINVTSIGESLFLCTFLCYYMQF